MPSVTLQPFTVPRVTTERLLLREPRADDFEAYAEHVSDGDLRRYCGGALDRREGWRMFLVGAGSWIVTESGWWMLEDRATKAVVGMVGAFYREGAPDAEHVDLEVGWSIYREAWNRGFAKESAAAALAWAIEHHDPPRVIAHIVKDNVASIKVAEAIGMTHAGSTEFYGEPSELYVIERR